VGRINPTLTRIDVGDSTVREKVFIFSLLLALFCFDRFASAQGEALPLAVGNKWVYDYDYSENVECEFAPSTSEDERGVIYLEVRSEENGVYLIKKTIKSNDGVVSTSHTRLFEDTEGLKEAGSGDIIVHYQQGYWSNYTYLFAESGSDNYSFLSGPDPVSVPSGTYSAHTVSMDWHYEPEIFFPAPIIIDLSSAEFYADGVGLVKSEWEKIIDNQSPPVCEYTYHTQIELTKEVPEGEDVYEPDNSSNQASAINLDSETQSHTFHTSGDVDYIKFNVQGDKEYSIETSNLQGGADTEIFLYDSNGISLLDWDNDSGGRKASQIGYTFPASGTYYAGVREKSGSGIGSYDISVREVLSKLYFPHIVSDAEWWTGIGCVNTANSEASLTMTGYDASGNPVENAASFPNADCRDLTVMGETVSNCPFLSSMGKTVDLAADYFRETESDDLAWARVISNQNITGFELFGTRTLDRLGGVGAPGSGALILYFPHVASDSDWSSRLVLVNTTANTATLSIEGLRDSGASVGYASGVTPLLPKEKVSETIANLFGAAAGQVKYVKVTSSQELTGLLILSHNSNPQIAGEPAITEGAFTLYFPHIPDSPYWKSRVTMINIGNSNAFISVTAYDDNGTPVGTNNFLLRPGEKFFGVPAEMFGGSLPAGAAYLKVISNQKLIGYDLFSTLDEMTMAGVNASAGGLQTFYFPHVASNNTWWTGLVFVNAGTIPASLTMTAYNKNGYALGTAQNLVTLGAREKRVDLAATFFSNNTLPFGAAWFKVESTQPLVALELFGTKNFTQLAGFTVSRE